MKRVRRNSLYSSLTSFRQQENIESPLPPTLLLFPPLVELDRRINAFTGTEPTRFEAVPMETIGGNVLVSGELPHVRDVHRDDRCRL